MQDVARRKKSTPRTPSELPEWMHGLKGFDQLAVAGDDEAFAINYDGVPAPAPDLDEIRRLDLWQVQLAAPKDFTGMEAVFDPVLLLALLAGGVAAIDEKIEELVSYCRSRGRSWTQIGEALGMSKQAAWERFSGED